MNIDHLIKLGRLDPILEIDTNGITMLTGWRRKGASRKVGAFTIRRPQPWITRGELTPGVKIVLAERKRQISREGWDAAHDDKHVNGELGRAAQCYEREPADRKMTECTDGPSANVIMLPESWPWDAQWWKPGDRIRELAKAGALYLAEADRLRRAGEPEKADLVTRQAVGCASGIDNLYRVTPMAPGPHVLHR